MSKNTICHWDHDPGKPDGVSTPTRIITSPLDSGSKLCTRKFRASPKRLISNHFVIRKSSFVIPNDLRDEIWVARVPELPGCMAHGDTQQEALEELQNAIPGWIEAALEAHFSFARPLPSIQTMKKASSLLNTAEVARLLGMAPRTLNARLKNGTPFKQVEAERLRDALAAHSLALM